MTENGNLKRRVRARAARTGESMTEAVRTALVERLQRRWRNPEQPREPRAVVEIQAIAHVGGAP